MVARTGTLSWSLPVIRPIIGNSKIELPLAPIDRLNLANLPTFKSNLFLCYNSFTQTQLFALMEVRNGNRIRDINIGEPGRPSYRVGKRSSYYC